MWIRVRIEAPLLDSSVQLPSAQLGAACVSQGSIHSKAWDTILSACYKRILFCAKTGDQDMGTLLQLAGEGLPRKEKRDKEA